MSQSTGDLMHNYIIYFCTPHTLLHMSNIPVPTSPSPVAKAPGSSKRVITTQATPVQRPPQPNLP